MRGIIRVSSVTYAMRAQKVLEASGIRANIRKVAIKDNYSQGCGFVLEVRGDPRPAAQIVSSAGIRIMGVSNA